MKDMNQAQQFLEVFEALHDEFSENFENEELLEIASRFLKVAQGKTKKPPIRYETENATNYSFPVDSAFKSKSIFYTYCLHFVQIEHTDSADYSLETNNKLNDVIWSIQEPAHFIECHFEARGINS